MARVAALETTLREIRNAPPGIGHNQGPQDFAPANADDLIEIDQLIVLLKQQSPKAITSPATFHAALEKTNKIADKIKEYSDLAFMEGSKSFGQEIGKQLARAPLWYGLWAVLTLTATAALRWAQSVPL